MWPQLGAPLGFLAANGLFLILVTFLGHTNGEIEGAFMTWGWRIPFLLSSVMVIVGLYVRFRLEETPVFKKAVESGKKAKMPLTEVFRTSWRPLILGTFIMVSCYTLFYLVTTWVLSYGIAKNGLAIPYLDFLKLQLISIFAFIISIPLAGRLADTRGRKSTLIVVSLVMIAFGFTFTHFLSPGSASEDSVLIFLTVGMFIMGLIFGPMSAVLPELFPTNVRYTGSGISYNVASILGAAIAPFVATALVSKYGVGAVGMYLIVVSVLSLIAIMVMKETKHFDMTDI